MKGFLSFLLCFDLGNLSIFVRILFLFSIKMMKKNNPNCSQKLLKIMAKKNKEKDIPINKRKKITKKIPESEKVHTYRRLQ